MAFEIPDLQLFSDKILAISTMDLWMSSHHSVSQFLTKHKLFRTTSRMLNRFAHPTSSSVRMTGLFLEDSRNKPSGNLVISVLSRFLLHHFRRGASALGESP